jgi:hypothetical protein
VPPEVHGQQNDSQPGLTDGRAQTYYASASVTEPGFISTYVATTVDAVDPDKGEYELYQRETIPDNASASVVNFAPGTLAGRYTFTLPFKAGFHVTHVAARHGHEYLAIGHPFGSDGPVLTDTLFAWWRFEAPDGAPYVTRTPSAHPINTPSAHSEVRIELGGDADIYIQPDNRKEFKHSTHFLGRTGLRVRLAEVDPDGRYALIVTNPEYDINIATKVYRLDLNNFYGAAPFQITTSALIPSLSGAKFIKRGRRTVGNAKSFVLNCQDGSHVLLEDLHNDGDFESIITLTHDQYVAANLHITAGWSDNYTNYDVQELFPPH